MTMMKKTAWREYYYQLGAVVLFLAALVLVQAHVEAGMNDDWSFVRTAQELAATGQLGYNAWSAPMIGFQAVWAALFIKVFGFSFFIVRCSSYLLTVSSIPVLWYIVRFIGMTCNQAFFSLALFLLSPLNLPNLGTFMTDMPAFLFFALTLLAAIKSWQGETFRSAALWMSMVVVAGLISGSIRQIYWLAPICFLMTLSVVATRSEKLRIFAASATLVTVATAILATHWLARQPYVPAETTLHDLLQASWRDQIPVSATYLARYFVGAAVLLLPFTCLSLGEAFRRRRLWSVILISICAAAVTRYLAEPLPWLGNTLTQDGILLRHTVSIGERPLLLSDALIMLIGTLGVATAILALSKVRPVKINSGQGRFAALTLPFLAAYVGVLALRSLSFGLYDRYLIPAVFILSTLAMGAYARTRSRVAPLGLIVGGLFALYSLATTHDYFAEARARLQAADEVLAASHSRRELLAGFEYDCWTQTLSTGHINNDQVTNPPDAYQDADDCNGNDDVRIWWRTLTPAIRARYVVTLTPLASLNPSEFKPVEFRRWLPPGRSHVYVQQARAADTPLACKASGS